MALKVLALDLGTKTGFAYNTDDGKLHAGTHVLASPKEITLWRKQRFDRRLDLRPIRLYQWLMHRLSESKPQILIFEDVMFSTTALATQMWATLRCALWMAAYDANIPIECVPVGTLKKFVTGNGHATKEAMEASVKTRWPDAWNSKLDDNAVDATGLFFWAQEKLKRYADSSAIPNESRKV
jgi:Holliday junction resolvasome RuvABC endonuclease subunit